MSTLAHSPALPRIGTRSPLLRFKSDEQLIALVRRDREDAFEVLFDRYRPRLLAFCRHMLRSAEDAEDVLQEAMVSAYRAIRADERTIVAKPWLYRIARNRCLNHLRRPVAAGIDDMDVFEREGMASPVDEVQGREQLRQIVADVKELPEQQRAALVLREMEGLSYLQIADVLDTTVPAVKSLLVRARMNLASAGEQRAAAVA